ncbi:putative F-box/LRR-repeat protein 23 [Rosa rugosa]|uniref:putative F-box/LRR-repeat protein 23 n=1 Tax=Rosa rugosa TaxID=74645 RepID=UPI002B401D3D|nr:putative F-box/LRR-repeat protein 23 [Rosa rugosa]
MAESGRCRRRNWTELPDELTAAILSRLGAVEILESAQKVCMKWRKISKEPLFWRKIDMRNDGDLDDCDYESMFSHIVDRSSGNVVDINIEHFGTDQLLTFITRSASTVRRIRLFSCDEVSDEGLSRMASKLRLLEELDISLCAGISHEAVKAVGRSCPLLKSFKFNKEWCRFSDDESDSDEYGSDFDVHDFDDSDDDYAHAPFARAPVVHAPVAHARVRKDDNVDALAIAGTMQDLHHLQLYGNKLTNDGLRKILDCCPHLESLDLRLCFNLNMGIDLETRCAERIKRLWLPHDSIEGKEFTARSDGYCFKWVELPDNITMSILSRLGTIDILESAQKVCMKWRKICKELKWNTIDMRNDSAPDITFDLEKMCRHVVDLSCGNLVDVNVEDFISDELLEYITDSSSGIRRLRLVCSYYISDEGLIEVASKLPLLEDLDISLCGNLSHKPVKVLGHSCRLLKSFKLNKEWHKYSDNFFEEIIDDEGPWSKDDDALAIAGTMHGLYHLQLFGNQLTNDGLKAILDGCPHLESLDLRYCFNLNLEGDLGRRCTEQIKRLLLPKDSIAGYGFLPSTDWQAPRSPKYNGGWGWDPFDDY